MGTARAKGVFRVTVDISDDILEVWRIKKHKQQPNDEIREWIVGLMEAAKAALFASVAPSPVPPVVSSAEKRAKMIRDAELNDKVDRLLSDRVSGMSSPQPTPKPFDFSLVPEVEHNGRGPIVRSDIIKRICKEIIHNANGSLAEWECDFLNDKLAATDEYVQIMFTHKQGVVFERLCYKHNVPCPFHIKPGDHPDRDHP